jgi:acetylornithine/succinyldiaminopimelate/putrescine aminotransferase
MACITATGQDKVKKDFGPLLEGFTHSPFNDPQAARDSVDEKTAAILVEPVQGEGGIHPATPEFLRTLRALCDEKSMLLLYDEVQCGLGRTGDWCGWRSIAPDVEPDAVSWAKGIANGFPLGSFWASSKSLDARGPLCDLLGAGSHGTTYGGNPVCCAAGSKVLDIIERDGLLAKAASLGSKLASALQSIASPLVSEVRHIGLMIGVELSSSFPECGRAPALELVHRAMATGLLLIPAGERVVRFLPPLNVQPAEIDEAVEKFASALKAVAAPSRT